MVHRGADWRDDWLEDGREQVVHVADPPHAGLDAGLDPGDRLSIVRHPDPPPATIPELVGRHVAVVGINYSPEVTGIAPYTTAMAEHLAGSAASVTVLTGTPHYPHWTVPAEYRWSLRSGGTSAPAPGAGVPRVRRLRHFVPRSQSVLRRGLYEATFFANARTVRLPRPPQLVVSVTPSLGGALAGASLARRHGAPLLIVVQDLLGKAAAQSGMSGGGRVADATAAIEGYALRRADRVAVVSDSFRSQVERYGVPPERVGLLRNWTHIVPATQTVHGARARLGWPADRFIVAHTGNIGLKQDLGNVVAAAGKLAGGDGIEFVIVGDGSQRAAVRGLAGGMPNVRFVDPLSEDEYPLALAAADLLLVNERPGVAEMSLPSKLTSYFSAGRPVLAAVEGAGATATELSRTGGAAVLVPPGDPDALVTAVRALRDDPVARAVMAGAGRAYASANLGRRAATDQLDVMVRELLLYSPGTNGRRS